MNPILLILVLLATVHCVSAVNNQDKYFSTGTTGPSSTDLILNMPFFNDSDSDYNTTHDFSNYNNNMTCTNCPTYNSTDGSYYFDGGDAASISNSIFGVDTNTTNFTMGLWINVNSTTSCNGINGSNGAGLLLDDYSYGIMLSASTTACTVRFAIRNLTAYIPNAGYTFTETGWAHVVGVYNYTTVAIYVNGVNRQSSSVNDPFGGIQLLNNRLLVGQGVYSGNARNYQGDLDEPFFFNRSLNESEIYALYKRGRNQIKYIISNNQLEDAAIKSKNIKYFRFDCLQGIYCYLNDTNARIVAPMFNISSDDTYTKDYSSYEGNNIKVIGSLDYNDANGYFEGNNTGLLNISTNASETFLNNTVHGFSLCLWEQRNSTDWDSLLYRYGLGLDSYTSYRYKIYGSNGSYGIWTSLSASQTDFTHFCATFNNNTNKTEVYLNGVLSDSITWNMSKTTFSWNYNPIWYGDDNGAVSSSLTGRLGPITLWVDASVLKVDCWAASIY